MVHGSLDGLGASGATLSASSFGGGEGAFAALRPGLSAAIEEV